MKNTNELTLFLGDKKLALAHDHLFQVGGAEKVLAVFADMFPASFIYTLINNPKISRRLLHPEKIKTSYLQKIPFSSTFFKYFLLLMPRAWEKTDLSSYDLIISSSSAFVKGLFKGGKAKHICYCHSPTRYLWDEKEEYIMNLSEGKFFRKFLPRFLDKLRNWDFIQAQKVDCFIANSQYIAQKINRYYKRQARVIYPPVKVDDFTISSEIADYYLIVSRLRPYKKVDLAIKAFNNLKLPLKIIGSGSEYKRLKKMARSNIEFLGELSDKQRNKYLAECKAFIYPQIEDFGISALEAMASGRPVIAYKRGGALETVVEGLSGTFFEEQTWESLAHKILRFDHNNFEPKKIRQHARQFDESIFKNKISETVAEFL